MTDIVSKDKRSEMMAGIKNKNTRPEILLRKSLFAQGLRYKLHDNKFPGKPDLFLKKHNVIIFINGCFWHGHQDCKLFKIPNTRKEFWEDKIYNNIKRDQKNIKLNIDEGLRVCTVWECLLRKKEDINFVTKAIISWLKTKEPLLELPSPTLN